MTTPTPLTPAEREHLVREVRALMDNLLAACLPDRERAAEALAMLRGYLDALESLSRGGSS